MRTWVHLPPVGTDPHRWVSPEAVEWFAASGVESVLRLRTGDTLRTSLSVTELVDRLSGRRYLEGRVGGHPGLEFLPSDMAAVREAFDLPAEQKPAP